MNEPNEKITAMKLYNSKKENIFLIILKKIKMFFKKEKEFIGQENNIDMVIFDLDGTLWETSEITYQVTNEVIQKYDFLQEISRETIDKTMGCTFEETASLYMPYIEKEEREIILKEILDAVSERLSKTGGNVYSGLEQVLENLKNKYKLAIVSNCADGYIESFLNSSNFGKYFVDFAAAAKMKTTKANAIKTVIERNNVKKAIYVGDTIKDFEASKLAKMDFIQAKYGFGPDLKTEYSINEISQLPKMLNNLK